MRILYFKIVNYIGIYNGMHLYTLEIDFSKSHNIITTIIGKNGTGKSTLLKALSPIPDNADSYIPNMPAYKVLKIIDGNNIYDITISSDITKTGNRATTKAYISKNNIELNSTGNIGSYKDILFSEFELDNNYITLSRLSGEDRGLAEKIPSERKRFVNSILNSLDTYNSINKNLTKKSNIFKSHINTLSTKIEHLGNEELLRSRLVDIDYQYKRIENNIEEYKKKKIEAESYIKLVDNNGSIQAQYNEIYNNLININKENKILEKDIAKNKDKIKDYISNDDIVLSKNNAINILDKYKSLIIENKNNINHYIIERESLIKEIDINKGKIIPINDKSSNELKGILNSLYKDKEECINIIHNSHIKLDLISHKEFDTIISYMVSIRENILAFYTKYNYNLINKISIDRINGIYTTKIDMDNTLNNMRKNKEDIISKISYYKSIIEQYDLYIEDIKLLDNRPSKCNIDDCPFIKKAIEYKNKNIYKERDKAIKYYNEYINKEKLINKSIEDYINYIAISNDIDHILDLISSNRSLLDRLPQISVIFTDTIELYHRLSNIDNFSEIIEVDKYIEYINYTIKLSNIDNQISTLVSNIKLIEMKENNIKLLKDTIDKDTTRVEELKNMINIANDNINFNSTLVSQYENTIDIMDTILLQEDTYKTNTIQKNRLSDQYNSIKDQIKNIESYIKEINIYDNNIANLLKDKEPLAIEKDNINYALISLNQYHNELNTYQEKFNIINTLKKYSSPTNGIQTVYMDMYMGKTLSIANELLSMLFNGEYKLLPYIINENEFRIPFIGNGLMVDDISKGSNSQMCMIGTIMNLVLLYQASSKYNIVFLDEVDAGLDSHNRYEFINTLYKLINVLNINQLLMISHNIESDLSNVDVIKLQGYDNDILDYSSGNIIFDYNTYIEK